MSIKPLYGLEFNGQAGVTNLSVKTSITYLGSTHEGLAPERQLSWLRFISCRSAIGQELPRADNDSYAYNWGGEPNVTRPYAVNGLNQYTQVSSAGYCSDKNGNLIWDGEFVYIYDAENRLVQKRAQNANRCPQANSDYTGALQVTVRYDPRGRLYETVEGSTVRRFVYDGNALVAVYDNGSGATGNLINRYVHGADADGDDPLIWFQSTSNTSSSNAKHLYADRLGSIVLAADSGGNASYRYTYDEWGRPGAGNNGRFQYTGQLWFAELQLYYYKARMYSPRLGRFMQTDPIGYDDQVNLYGYVANDPVNKVDFTGKEAGCVYGPSQCSGPVPSPQEQEIRQVAFEVATLAIPVGGEIVVTARAPGFFARAASFFGRLFGGAKNAERGAASAKQGVQLQKQLASEAQMSQIAKGEGTVLGQPAKQADRIAGQTGGNPADIQR